MAVEVFLELQGIKGESKAAGHPGAIDIESFQWGATNVDVAKRSMEGRKGTVQVKDMCFTKRVDNSTPKLAEAVALGKKIPKAELILRKAGGKQEEYMRYTLEDVYVTQFHTSGHPGGTDLPADNFCLNFRKITIKYAEQTEIGGVKGPVQITYDVGEP